MERSSTTTDSERHKGLHFYTADDELPPGGSEALKRRTEEELQAAADRAARGR